MKKINWFSRLFISWDSLESYFTPNIEVYEKRVQDKDIAYENIVKQYENRIQQKDTSYENMIQQKDKSIQEKDKIIGQLNSSLLEANNSINEISAEKKAKTSSLTSSLTNKEKDLNDLKTKLENLNIQLIERTKQNDDIKIEIRDQLKTIDKIENTFFAKTGNKGVGELGEQQVRVILEKSGLPADMWVENLMVGKNTVEFAMQSGEKGKFIPIDSKVLDTVKENGKAIIDESYKSRVKTQAQSIKKYLSKSNTAEYGILVLQSDSIYMELFDLFPSFFQEMVTEFKVYINSPSSFVQTAHSISHLIDIYKRVHNDEKIYEDMVNTLTSVTKFANSLSKVHSDFNTAMETHYPTIAKRQENLVKRLKKTDKIKEIPVLKDSKGK